MQSLILKYLVLPIALFAVSAFVFWQFDLGLWNDIQTAREVIAKNKAVLAERERLAENLKKLIEQYKEKISDVSKIGLILPQDPAIPNLLVMLEALAGANSLQFNGVDFTLVRPVSGPAALQVANLPPPGVQIVQVNVKVKGSYENFSRYLRTLETNIRLLDTMQVTFNVPPAAAGGPAGTEFIATINAYYQ